MAVKSVLEVEVQSQAFDRYRDLYNRYQEALRKQPALWKAVGKETIAVQGAFNKMAAAVQAQARTQRDLGEVYKSQTRYLMQGERLWGSMARHARGIAGDILSATRTLLSWSGIIGGIGGLLGAGGIFGLDRMARSISGERSAAMGFGMSIGQKKSFDLTFGARGLNTDALLGWISQMEVDPSAIKGAAGLGVRLTGNTSADAIAMLRAIRSRARAQPGLMGMMPKMFGLEGVSTENIRQLAGMGNPEFERLASDQARLAGKLNIPDPDAQRWQSFLQRLGETGGALLKTIERGLMPLARPLEKLSGAFEAFLTTLGKSHLVEHAIEDLAGWLGNFAGKINKPEFLKAVDRFTDQVDQLADDAEGLGDIIQRLLHPWWNIKDIGSNLKSFFAPSAEDLKAHPGLFERYLGRLESHFDLPSGLMATVRGLEHSGASAVSPKGAMGTFQLMPGTAQQYGAANPFDPVQNANAEAKFLAHLRDKYKGDLAKILAANNWGEGNLDKDIAQHPNDWRRYLPKETRQYLMNANPLLQANGINVTVTINTPPGSDLTASASAMAH